MNRVTLWSTLAVLIFSAQSWTQTQQTHQTRIKPTGETYVLERSNPKASAVAPGAEEFPILETSSKGESKADVHRVVLERTFDTPKRIRVKLNVPLFKYKPIMSGTEYFVETTKEVVDKKTGNTLRVKDIQKTRFVWCGIEPCLKSTPFLLQACKGSGMGCTSAYEEIIIDFSKAQQLNVGEHEQFFISAYQRKIPGKAIDFLVHPIKGRILPPRYIVERKNKLFGPDVYIIRLPNKKEIRAENKKNQVDEKDILDLQSAVELNKNTRYTTLPVSSGLPGQPVDPRNEGAEGSNGVEVEEVCLDEMGRIKSSRTIIEGHANAYEDGSDVRSKVENNVASSACTARKNQLVLEESLAGQKGALNRADYLKRQSSVNDANLGNDLEIEED